MINFVRDEEPELFENFVKGQYTSDQLVVILKYCHK